MKKVSLWLLIVSMIAVFSLAGCSCNAEAVGEGGLGGEPPIEEKRPMTYYTAKQAFARLTLYLREHNQALPKMIWAVLPERTAIYSHDESGRMSGIVGGWVFFFEDEQGRTKSAKLNCWGEVIIQEEETGPPKAFPHAIELDEWVLDNTDAHRVVLTYGGEGRPDDFSGRLIAADVEGRGIRPVWAGGAWYMPDRGFLIIVDAQKGELYSPIDENKLESISPTQGQVNVEWNGGFDEESYDAIKSRDEYDYWWPYAYQTFEGRYVYNRKLLKEKLQEEQVELNRDGTSWMSSGIFHVVLGEWVEAIDDFNKAVIMEPKNENIRYYRGLCFLCIRDLDKAASDFQALSGENRNESLEYVAMFRGEKDRGGLTSFMRNVSTNCGMIPWEVQIGPISLAPYQYD